MTQEQMLDLASYAATTETVDLSAPSGETGGEVQMHSRFLPNYLTHTFALLDEDQILRAHISTLVLRMIRAAMRNDSCVYRVCAAGIDNHNRIISIATNRPRYANRGLHAEERVMYSSPRSLHRILILRVGARGDLLPISACRLCARQAAKRGIVIESIGAPKC